MGTKDRSAVTDLAAFYAARLDDTQLFAEAALEGWPDEFAGDIPREQALAMHILADVKAGRAILALMTEAHAAMDKLIADPHAGTTDQAMAIGRARAATIAVKHLAAAHAHHPAYSPEYRKGLPA